MYLRNNFKSWARQLSDYWKQDISKDDYDYQKYYNDNPVRAWNQLYSILKGNTPHFEDAGKSGVYKKKSHPTYPWLGNKSWSHNNQIYYLSKDQFFNNEKIGAADSDRTLDYLGSDYGYNNGGTKVVYNNGIVLPTLYVIGNRKGQTVYKGYNLKPNKTNNGFVYKDRN